jgi:hypothetical protein
MGGISLYVLIIICEKLLIICSNLVAACVGVCTPRVLILSGVKGLAE